MTHKCIWKKSNREHKRPPRFFVECECGEIRQAVVKYGHLHVFNTGKSRGGKTRILTLRISDTDYDKWKERNETVRKTFERGMNPK